MYMSLKLFSDQIEDLRQSAILGDISGDNEGVLSDDLCVRAENYLLQALTHLEQARIAVNLAKIEQDRQLARSKPTSDS